MNNSLIRSERYVIYRSSVFRTCLLVALLVSVFFVVSTYVAYVNPSLVEEHGADIALYKEQAEISLLWPSALVYSVSKVNERGVPLAMIIVGAIVTSGYVWGTTRGTLVKGVGRKSLYLAKLTSLAMPVTLAVVVLPILAELLLTGLSMRSITGSIPWGSVNWMQYGLAILRAAYSLIPYMALAALLAVRIRSAVGVVGSCLGFFFAELLLISSFKTVAILKFLPLGLYTTLASGNMLVMSNASAPHAPLQSLPIVLTAVWTALFVLLGLRQFEQQDIE